MGSFNLVVRNIKLYFKYGLRKRNRKVILFGSWFGERYADTSRFLFQYLSRNKKQLGLEHVVWVTRNEEILKTVRDLGYEAYLIGSEESNYYHKIAGYHIVCNRPNDGAGFQGDIEGFYSFGAKRLNLWHGVMPLKGVGNATNTYKRYKQEHPYLVAFKEFLSDHFKAYRILFHDIGGWGDCYYLSVTPEGTKILKQFFRMPDNHYIETTNPRIKECYSYTDSEIALIERIKKSNYVILYTPTFRDKESTFDFYSAGLYVMESVEDESVLWIQKPHSAAIVESEHARSKNIIDLPSAFDLNIIMPYINLLITDYSSVAADAMYYYKPILYYMPDMEEYAQKDRGFLSDPKDLMVSEIITTPENLVGSIYQCLSKKDIAISDKYKRIRDVFWGPEKSFAEIWDDINKAMK